MNSTRLTWVILFVIGAGWIAFRAATTGAGTAYVEATPTGYETASPAEYAAGLAEFSPFRTVGIWVAALMTLCILSFLYGDNPFYKFAESVVIGVSAAYWMVVSFWTTLVPNLLGKLWPAWVQSWAMPGLSPVRETYWWTYLVPLALGVMLLWRLLPSGGWISRWPLAFVIGATAGIRLVGFIQADFLSQIRNTILPLVVMTDGRFDPWESIKNILTVASVLCCLVYFFFSIEHEGVAGRVSRVGIWVLMITFGAAFGYTVMGRFALLALRFEFLFDDWLWIIDPLGRRAGFS